MENKNIINEASHSTLMQTFKEIMNKYSMYIFFIIIAVTFQILTNGILMKPLNVTNIILQNGYVVVLAVGMMILIILGHIDLSVGSVAGFVGAIAAILMVNNNLSPLIAIIICLVIGAAVGGFQGFWVAYVKVPAFIATLAGMLIFKGLMIVVTGGKTIGPFPEIFQYISSGYLPDIFNGSSVHIFTIVIALLVVLIYLFLQVKSYLRKIKAEEKVMKLHWFILKNILVVSVVFAFLYILALYRGIPNILLLLGFIVAIYHFVTTKTVIGRHIYAIGGNEKAANLSGINTKKTTLLMFVNMGVLAAIGGIIFAARLNSATATAGAGFEMDAIAACYIGGASAYGGVGTILGAVLGALVMGLLNNGMSIMGIGIDWQQAIKGLVLLLVVAFDVYSKSKATK
ncbi:MAG: multiple monosaccharide ABC transporter permease [Anaerorhabdus sp.]